MGKTVIIGLIGSTLDSGDGPKRWNHWRPTVSLCQQDDLLVGRFELLHGRRDVRLVDLVREDMRSVSPETEVRTHEVEFEDPWDFDEVFGALHDFARAYPFDPEQEDYLVHITTGTHVAQICLFLLTESRHFPARLIQTSPPKRMPRPTRGCSQSSTSTFPSMTGWRPASRASARRQPRFSSPESRPAIRASTA